MIKTKSRLKAFLLSFFLIVCCVFSQKSHAQNKIDALSEGNITFFILTMTEMTSGANLETSQANIVQFLNRHLHPKARFKSALQYNIPGFPAQENSIALNKEQFIENVQHSAQSMDNYQTSIEVQDIRISKDGQKATLRTIGRESGTMNASGELIPVEGDSHCTQIIMLSDKGVIQIYNANCATTIRFQEY